MSDHHHHHQHRPHRLSLPPRTTIFSSSTSTATTTRPYPTYSYLSTPTPTPSKQRLPSSLSLASKTSSKSSLSFLFLLLFSLRSLYSLLPFLQSSPPSFSLFPFSFLVSLLSFLLSLSFSLLPSQSYPKYSFNFKNNYNNYNQPIFSIFSISLSQHKLLLSKSLLLAVVFLLRFQALRFCGTAAMILAELSGNVAARFVTEFKRPNGTSGFLLLFTGLSFLSISWDRIDCFPFSTSFIDKYGFTLFPREKCVRIWSMLLPFSSGFLGCYERVSMNWGTIRQLGLKRVRLVSLFYTTVLLFIPAVVSFIMFERGNDGVSIANFGWPLANTVVFGVLLSENYSEDKLVYSKDLQREFLVTFVCTILLELFYFPELSLWGLFLCGLLLYFAVRKLDPFYWNYLQLGLESSEPLSSSIMKPIRHIVSERKSRKIALFLLINTGYMVVEFVAGFMSNSLGLISDACHMLFDCAALAIGLYASYISRLPANNQFNYGRGRFEVLSGYVNAVLLVLVGALIVLESLERILDPQEISTNSLLTVSIGGLVVNIVGLIFFHEEHHHAHGGSGSCSHSHPHSHSHSHQHTHVLEGPDEKHHKCISVSYDCQEKTLISHCDHLEHHQCDHDDHDHTHHDDHGNQSHHHHNHHDHSPLHEPCDHHHHDHTHHDDHGNQSHHHHNHHDHSPLHEPCDHHHHDHDHGNFLQSHTHTHHSETESNFSLENSGFQQRNLVSDEEQSQNRQHHHIDHNMEGIFLHVLADTMGSVGVVMSTLLIKYKGWLVADPACSIFISVLIVSSVIPLLRNSAEILLQRVPRAHEKDLRVALNDVMKIKGVHGIRNFHVWSFTNTDVVGTMHLHVSAETDKDSMKDRTSHIFHDAGIKDLTVQVECIK
ncbi:probable zinc transporter protein DDB_G0291141 isoform X1 [Ricinus communis]|uniref:probable zinc transporter protein DDB_G0291141 isoform X1 n=1 Tax=Ricinus communis TaxID=3988 RepID=UPI00201AB358|nr:probable zinc transporter protein DDB_G0291141 isoform X1 [Ricinus communis]